MIRCFHVLTAALSGCLLLLAAGTASAQDESSAVTVEETTASQVEDDLETLKQSLIQLNRELFLLEEDLLAPGDTQVAVFVSLDRGSLFALDSVQVKIDDKEVANYLYTQRELAALQRGGVQRVFLGNLAAGEHEIVGLFIGVGPRGRDYKRGASLKFEKSLGPKYLELHISDDSTSGQPQFEVREWD